MSNRKELEEQNNNIIKAISDSLGGIKEIVDFTSQLHERKLEAEAFRVLIDNATDIEIDELYAKFSPIQKRDEQSFVGLSSKIGEVKNVMTSLYSSTSGTASVAYNMAYTQVRDMPPYTVSEPVRLAYKKVANYKSRKAEIPKGLNHLQPDLGMMFLNVHDTVDKAKNKVITVKQAISDMRDVLNHIWGNLVDIAAKRYPKRFRSGAHKEFKTIANHANVAECLMTNPLNRGKFQLLLDNMYSLYSDMSHHGKNPLNDDLAQLEEFYSRWIIQIDGVVGMINWREWEDGHTLDGT